MKKRFARRSCRRFARFPGTGRRARAARGDGGYRSRPGTSAGAGAYLALGFLEASPGEAEETLCV